MSTFQIGDQVIWWKRIGRKSEYPYRAAVVASGPKRVTILVQDPDDASGEFIRQVTPKSLHVAGRYFVKTSKFPPLFPEGPTAAWGAFTRYLEIGDDLWTIRQVDQFENGNLLCYDRVHWVDSFSGLGDARINRNRTCGEGWRVEEIDQAEFNRVWEEARTSPTRQQQLATVRISCKGEPPPWLSIRGWRPRRANQKT